MAGDIVFGRFEVKPAERSLHADGVPLPVGSRAYEVLLALLRNRNRIITKAELLDTAWPGLVVEENNLTVQISSLRKMLGPDAIATIPGRGYQFSKPVDGDAPAPAAVPRAREPEVRPGPEPAVRRPTNLPDRLPPLYGRETDLDEVTGLLDGHALVTIAGPGGIGKTRLAEAVALQVKDRYPHGVWMVELASLTDPSLLAETVAQALQLTLPGHLAPRQELIAALREQELLLVIDNCEHLIDAVAALATDILRDATGVRMLLTSQELLRQPDEQLHRLGPLAVPQAGHRGPADHFGAVRLFVERVRVLDQRFALTPDNIDTVVSICAHLDGMALAIELAAARVPMYGVDGIHAQLGERLRLLTAGTRGAPKRHQTLRAALDWSHGLLGDEERRLFRRLGLFFGGFTIESAQAVGSDAQMDQWVVADHLAALIDKSLVTVDAGVRPRYRMLETTRAYAIEKLAEAGEQALLAQKHAVATLALLERAVKQRDVEAQVQEMNNVRAAYAWALGPAGDPQVAVAIATRSSVVLAVEGFVVEALDRLRSVEPLVDDSTPAALAAQYWQWLGRCGLDGRIPVPQAVAALRRAHDMYRAQGNLRHQHACLRMTAQALLEIQDFDGAMVALGQALAMEDAPLPLADRMRRLRVQGMLEDRLALYANCLETYERACQLADSAGIERYVHILLSDIAAVHLKLGHAEDAASRYGELVGKARRRRTGGLTLCYALSGLATALISGGRLQEARDVMNEAVPLLCRSGIFMARCDILAWLLARETRLPEAARLAGAADAFRRRSGSSRDAVEQLIRQEVESLLLAAHPADRIGDWLAEGAASSEQALAGLLA